ncbi:MAG TPA: hemerythrin domain-containing protein [Polyangiaceae bacterium]|nr:hemerythrin domain-containing protein [Polyangiaceae bacterium]
MKLLSLGKSQPRSALDLLKTQHDEVKALFKRIEKANTRAAKVKFFDELAAKLAAHDAIEREIFYPACEKALGMIDLLGEALVEHGVVEFSLYQADLAKKDRDFSFKCQVLSELVEHHVQEEEDDFFPKVQKALGKEKLLELGARMSERFEQAKARDFHAALKSNLKQVLSGSLKPTKRASRSSGGSSRRSKAVPTSKRRKAAA